MSSLLTKCVSSNIRMNKNLNNVVHLAKASASTTNYETLSVKVPKEYVYHVELNRPEKLNAMNYTLWVEIGKCFHELNTNADCRVIVLSGAGKLFCAGLDFKSVVSMGTELLEAEDVCRKAKIIRSYIQTYQTSITSLELCQKPVLAAVHSACVGGGINLITAADMRYCTKDAWFQVKEVDLGMAADVGVLQRLPKVIGSDSLAREICYTARKLPADEALSCGLVSKVFTDKEKMLEEVLKVAEEIASKSPVAVQGTKHNIVYSRDHTVQEGLDYMAAWNQLAIQSEDMTNAASALMSKQRDVVFSKL